MLKKATREERITGELLSPEEWKRALIINVYNHFLIEAFGKKITATRKTEQAINNSVNRFCRIWGYSRKFEVRHASDKCGNDFLDFLKSKVEQRTVFTNYLMDYIHEEKFDIHPKKLERVSCAKAVARLAKIRGDNSVGNNVTLRRVYKEIAEKYNVCWSNRLKRKHLTSKSKLIESDPKLQKLFKEVVDDMVTRIGDINVRSR